jgi:hypothetical protein
MCFACHQGLRDAHRTMKMKKIIIAWLFMLQMRYNQNATLIQDNPLRLGCEKNYVSKKDCLFSRGFFGLILGVGVEVRSGVQPPGGHLGEGEVERIGGCDQGGGLLHTTPARASLRSSRVFHARVFRHKRCLGVASGHEKAPSLGLGAG